MASDARSILPKNVPDLYENSPGRLCDRSPENGNLTFILIDSYSESSGRPGGRSIPPQNGNDIHTDRFLL